MTLLLLTASVLLGVLTAGRFSARRWPRFLSQGLHRNISLLVLVFLALHVGTTVIDTYTSIPLTAAFIPFASSYKAAWLSLGAVALDMLVALVATSLLRARIGHRAWRRVHWLAYACWPVAVTHGAGHRHRPERHLGLRLDHGLCRLRGGHDHLAARRRGPAGGLIDRAGPVPASAAGTRGAAAPPARGHRRTARRPARAMSASTGRCPCCAGPPGSSMSWRPRA